MPWKAGDRNPSAGPRGRLGGNVRVFHVPAIGAESAQPGLRPPPSVEPKQRPRPANSSLPVQESRQLRPRKCAIPSLAASFSLRTDIRLRPFSSSGEITSSRACRASSSSASRRERCNSLSWRMRLRTNSLGVPKVTRSDAVLYICLKRVGKRNVKGRHRHDFIL